MTAVRPGYKTAWLLALALLCVMVPLRAVAAPGVPRISTPPPTVSTGKGDGGYTANARDASSGGGNPQAQSSTPVPAPNQGSAPPNNATSVNAPAPNLAPCGLNGQFYLVPAGTGSGVAIQPSAMANTCPAPPPPPLTPATSPPPDLTQYYAQVFEEIRTSPGIITAAPPNHTGLVNLPACFWLTGQAVPQQKRVTMDLKGAPDSAGQQITYHITLTVSLQYATWNFGDGSTTGTPAPTVCVGISGDPPSLVAHDYVTYSNPEFMVTASETYDGSVNMTWSDSNGPESEAVPGPTETIATAPYPIKVDQEEGVGTG